MRSARTIFLLLLVSAAVALLAQPRLVAERDPPGSAYAVGYDQSVKIDAAAADTHGSQSAAADHDCEAQGTRHQSRSACCSIPPGFGLQPGCGAFLTREALLLDPVVPAPARFVVAAHLNGIERPPKHG